MRLAAALLLGYLAGCHADLGRIMSFEEYAHADDTPPIIVRAARGRGRLLYFGARHNFDPGDAQVEHITRLWREFAPTLLLYEGPRHDARALPRDDVIRAEGDGGPTASACSPSPARATSSCKRPPCGARDVAAEPG